MKVVTGTEGKRNWPYIFIGLLSPFVVGLTFSTWIPAIKAYRTTDDPLTAFANINAPVYAFVSALLLLIAFLYQQGSDRRKEADQHFFNLIQLFNQGVSQAALYDSDNVLLTTGKPVFVRIREQIGGIYNLLEPLFVNEPMVKYPDKEAAATAYIFAYYGIETDGQLTIRRMLKHLPDDLIEASVRAVIKSRYEKKDLLYLSNQAVLGHYMRTLFHAIDFLDRDRSLNNHERYTKAKALRGTLSDPEIFLIAFNALSSLGSAWVRNDRCLRAFRYLSKTNLLYKYRFIKNIPYNYCFGFDLTSYIDRDKMGFEFDQ